MMQRNIKYTFSIRTVVAFAIALSSVLLASWMIYHPGLNGSFLFDDLVNLDALGNTGPIHDWPSFLRYITSGVADPTGRPLTLLSFLLDAQNWPADPFSFKRTNVLLHILNGTLLCWVMLKLGAQARLNERHNVAAATLGSAIWLLHPLFISTTLYVVQREAILPTTFSLIGILLWCVGRSQLNDNRIMSAWISMAAGSLLCTFLAVLCKGNGALLPLLIGVTECTILHINDADLSSRPSKHLQWQRIALLAIPTALLAFYLLSQIPTYIQTAADKRPWTITQRLLSEPRILMTYQHLLWFPRATSQGLFNDQTLASISWFTPWTTVPCMFAVTGLCAFAWLIRKRHSMLAFAILFYFAGQVMESTFIPLELFFEHRNYLPATFIFWPLAAWLTEDKSKLLRNAIAVLIPTMLSFLTWSGAKVWGDPRQQALIWATTNLDSARAQAVAAAVEMKHGKYANAISRLRNASLRRPDEIQLTLNLVDAECTVGRVTPETWQLALFSLRHTTNGSQAMFSWFADAIQRAKQHACSGLTLADIHQALQAAQSNPLYRRESGVRQGIAHTSGLLDLAEKKPQSALDEFNCAFLERPNQEVALAQAALFGAAGYPAYGLRHLDFTEAKAKTIRFGWGMPRLHNWVLVHQGYWQHETTVLRATLTSDAAKQPT